MMSTVDSRLPTLVHELSNMLTVIRGAAELAKRKLEPDHPAHGDVDEVLSAADGAVELTRELLVLTAQR